MMDTQTNCTTDKFRQFAHRVGRFFVDHKVFWFDFVVVGAVLLVSGLFFNHEDTAITSIHGNILIDCILRGDFTNFYDVANAPWNANIYVSRDFASIDEAYLTVPAIYPIFTYLFYGLWNAIPHLFLILIGDSGVHAGFFLIWAKILELIFCLICAHFLRKILALFNRDQGNLNGVVLYFFGSTFLIYGSFIFNQIEIFYLTFFVIGLYYFLEKRYVPAFVLFSLSSAFKYFTLIPAFFLLVHRRPKFKEALISILILITPILIDSLLFAFSLGHGQMSYIRDFGTRWFDASVKSGLGNLLFMMAWMIVGVVISFVRKQKENGQEDLFPFWIVAYSFVGLFVTVECNPQWFTLLSATLALMVFLSKRRFLSGLLETFAGLGFLIAVIAFFNGNASQSIAKFGLIETIWPHHVFKNLSVVGYLTDLSGLSLSIVGSIGQTVFIVGTVLLLLVNLDMLCDKFDKLPKGEIQITRIHQYLRLCIPLLLVIPALTIYYGEYDIRKIDANAYATTLQVPFDGGFDSYTLDGDYISITGHGFRTDQVNVKNKYAVILDNPNDGNDFLVATDKMQVMNGRNSWLDDIYFVTTIDLKKIDIPGSYNVYISFTSNGGQFLLATGKEIII